MPRKRLPVRRQPILSGIEQLHTLRAHPAYGEGTYIAEAAGAAFALEMARSGQVGRRAMPRAELWALHQQVAERVDRADRADTVATTAGSAAVRLSVFENVDAAFREIQESEPQLQAAQEGVN